ncbi:transketolase family protein [Spirochaeta isovalerica]|uniref:Transketolase n=1 Tax=Spirochaeta isovalerica TaxID=150 RepID=A0A841REU7_9SPIO|nr:transketolase C-terminal domain-containing protein [Spirochaeta isovalerica]MBB6482513.1 transketolase [Spirochaeta isovalerica]
MSDKDMREVYTETLIEMAGTDERICVLEADLMRATGTGSFKDKFPERAFNVGVAEANMVGVASGLSAGGKIPWAATFGCFAARRTYDQFFISANYAQQNVKLVGTDPGVTAAFNGGTHMPFEDTGLMRCIPGLVIFEPCDSVSLKSLIKQATEHKGSTYMRLQRKGKYTLYSDTDEVILGKGNVLKEGDDLTIIASGYVMVPETLAAADLLIEEGIKARVIDMHTVKPLDRKLVVESAEKTGAILVCENHQKAGGLFSAVSECLGEEFPVPVAAVAVEDQFGQVGTLEYLKEAYGFTKENIVKKAKELMGRK